MIQQLLPDKTRQQVRAKFKTEEKKNPLLVHDAIIHRSGGEILLNSGFLLTFDLASFSACILPIWFMCADNLYFKKVIKNLNIEDVAQQEVNNTHKQDGASSERGPEKEVFL